jgi:hypothetical protein
VKQMLEINQDTLWQRLGLAVAGSGQSGPETSQPQWTGFGMERFERVWGWTQVICP